MRIAIPTGSGAVFPAPACHSIARVTEFLVRGLKELGHEPCILAPATSRIDCEVIPICDSPVLLEEDPEFRIARDVQHAMLRKLQTMLPGLDIVHAHGIEIASKLFTTGMLQEIDFPNVTTCHTCIELVDLDYFLNLRNPLVSVSDNQRRACPTLNFVATVHNGLDPSDFPVTTAPGDYLCFLGRLVPGKQPHVAMELAIRLGIELRIAGPPDYVFARDYFESQCKPYFRHPLIKYLGELGFSDKVSLLANARCNLHPTGCREAFGLTIVEAGYCGTPTLAIRRGSLPELIEDGRTGVLVEDFAEGYHRIHECFQLDRGHISASTRSRFNYRRMALAYERVYHEVITGFETGCAGALQSRMRWVP